MKNLIFFLGIFLMFFSCSREESEPAKPSVKGKIIDNYFRKPVAGLPVILKGKNCPRLYSACITDVLGPVTTNDVGEFEFLLPKGSYTFYDLEIYRNDYQDTNYITRLYDFEWHAVGDEALKPQVIIAYNAGWLTVTADKQKLDSANIEWLEVNIGNAADTITTNKHCCEFKLPPYTTYTIAWSYKKDGVISKIYNRDMYVRKGTTHFEIPL